MRVLRTILILLLIVLRPVLLAVLWPVTALVRSVTFGSPLVLLFLVVILLHTSDLEQRAFAWSLIATMAGFALASAGLTALQRKLRENPMLWFDGSVAHSGPFAAYWRGNLALEPGIAAGIRSYPRSLPPARRR